MLRPSLVPARWPALCCCLLGMAGALSVAQIPDHTGAVPAAPVAPPPGPAALPLSTDELVGFLHHIVDWYHHVIQVAQLPGAIDEPVIHDRLLAQAQAVLRLALSLGKAASSVVGPNNGAAAAQAGTSVLGQLRQAGGQLGAREASLKEQLAAADAQLGRLRGQPRRTLQLHRDNLAAALEMVHEVQASLQLMQEAAYRAGSGGGEAQGTLAGQLAELERALPEGKEAAPPASVAPPAVFREESAGILALLPQVFALRGTQGEMTALRKKTETLLQEMVQLRAALSGQAHQIIQRGMAAAEQHAVVVATEEQRQAIEADTARFKRLATLMVPLSEQELVLSNALGTLEEWSQAVDRRLLAVMRFFAVRVGVLLASVLAVLVASDLWRRATLRYVRDPARRRPLLVMRRLLVGLALVVVVAFGLASEVGSLATFMGFLTAGIALTLQNVILSVVAYFFLIGRYGVQVGDLITLGGATGRVIDVSMLRLYMLELAGADLHSTGRVVVLSNAVLFQPTALYKQIPGADYIWHVVTLTLAPGADIEAASRLIRDAAAAVFREHGAEIQRQHALIQQHVEFEGGLARPQVSVEVAADGVRCSVRYPVPPGEAAAIDQSMLEALRSAIESDGHLQLLSAASVKLTSDAA